MKALKTKTTSSNLQIQRKQASKPFFQKGGESMFSNEAATNIQTKPFFSSDFETQANEQTDKNSFFSPVTIQPKLTVGQPNDKYEQEADAMADLVVQKLEQPGSSPDIQAKCSKCEQEEKIQEKPIFESKEDQTDIHQQKEEGEEAVPEIQEKSQLENDITNSKSDLQSKKEPGQTDQVNNSNLTIQRQATLREIPDIEEEMPAQDESIKDKELTAETPLDDPANNEDGSGHGLINLPEVEKEEVKPPEIQQVANDINSSASSPSENIEQSIKASKGNGMPLDKGTQSDMEGQFGKDFSSVRVHDNTSAIKMNTALGAKAFTNEQDIYFNSGEYDTNSKEGKKLLAHELTHTIQQGGSDNTIQKYEGPAKEVEPVVAPPNPNDGVAVENRMNNRIENDSNVQEGEDLSEEERNERENPDRRDVRQESSEIQSTGESSPVVDRGSEAQSVSEEQQAQVEEQINGEEEGAEQEETEESEEETSDLAEAEAAAQRALHAERLAQAVEIPEEPQAFEHVEIETPKDSANEDLPRNAANDTKVRGLGYIGEMLRTHGYEMKQHSAEKEIHAHGLDSTLERQREDLARAKEGTSQMEQHSESRKEVAEQSKETLTESEQRQQFVAENAPSLAQEADEGREDSSALAQDSREKADHSQSETPDDPDARADAEQQNADMEESAGGAESMDQAIAHTGDRARQYIEDAALAADQNQQSQAEISETDALIAQTDARITEMNATNQSSEAAIENSSAGPDIIRQQSARTAKSGDELIAASNVMEIELHAIQDEYMSGMASIESIEDARTREEERAQQGEENEQAGMSPEEMELAELAGMSDEEMDETISEMSEDHKSRLMAALENMISMAPGQGTDATEGRRFQVNTGLNDMLNTSEADPRASDIQNVEDARTQRLNGVLDVADQNMGFLSAAQQAMLADRLTAESITDDISNISVLQMGADMIRGMIDPRMSMQGIVGGFEKTLSGVANIFNAEAWRNDPLGNLLQIAADITTGLAMVFSSVLGLAAVITALMVALIIFSLGVLTPMAAPVIGWMGTVMTYAGWGAMITGTLAVYYNSLAYIKNLFDASTADTARELFGNVEQMKQNATDGFQGAMAIAAGVGAAKMGPRMSSGQYLQNVPRSPGQLATRTLQNARAFGSGVAGLSVRAARGLQRMFQGGRQGLIRFKNRVSGFFRRRTNRNGISNTPRRIPQDSPYVRTHDIELRSGGHTYRRRRSDGTWCRFSTQKCGLPDTELPRNVQQQVGNIPPAQPWQGAAPVSNPNPGWTRGKIPCFQYDTLVSTTKGFLSIQQINIGDMVMAFDLQSRKVVERKVYDKFQGQTYTWIEIYINETKISTTKKHPIWIDSEKSWINAEDLKVGMEVLKRNGKTELIKKIITLNLPNSETTYNLSIEGVNNFYAGHESILVHNDDKTRLSRPGWTNYKLIGPDGKAYYHGIYENGTGQPGDAMRRHAANNNRFRPHPTNPELGDQLIPDRVERTYGEARRMEHERVVRDKTHIGRDGKNYRGNRQYPMGERSFERYYRPDACAR